MKSVMLFFSLAACATGSVGVDRETTSRTGIQLTLVPAQDAERVFPAVVEATLPSADRLAHQVRARLGDTVTAELELCVSPAGAVTSAALARTTGFDRLDDAIMRDAAVWKFDSRPGPANVRTCERAMLTYRTP